MNPQQKPWTVADLTALRHLYPRKGATETARILGRSLHATQVRAHLLGLSAPPAGIVWTPQMLKLLNDHFATMFNRDLAKLTGVSPRSIVRKARELGLEKAPGFLDAKRADISRRAGAAKKGRPNAGQFRKGEHPNRATEFKPGHTESPETRARRSASMKAWHQRRKLLERLGLRPPRKMPERAKGAEEKRGAEGVTIHVTKAVTTV